MQNTNTGECISMINANEFHRKLLRDNLKQLFGEFDDTILKEIEHRLEWKELKGGETLLKEGDKGDSLFFVISGRLGAYKSRPDQSLEKIGEVHRGETVGEMAVFTGEDRSATIIAQRDSVLVKLSRELFEKVISEYPEVSLNVTRLIIQRLKLTQGKKEKPKPVNICLLPIHPGLGIGSYAAKISDIITPRKTVCCINRETWQTALNISDPDISIDDHPVLDKQLTQWLNDQEVRHDLMFFICDDEKSSWNERSLRHADHIVLIGDATQQPALSEAESSFRSSLLTNVSLVLIHPEHTLHPEHTTKWLKLRPWVVENYHIRKNHPKDLARLARILSNTAIGLVMAGGGAKGFAHIGIVKALEEHGIPVDVVAGTSIGAMTACGTAFNMSVEKMQDYFRQGAEFNPMKDLNWIPVVSLVKGKRMSRMIQNTIRNFTGRDDVDMTDTWLPLHIVATNYSKYREEVFSRGSVKQALLASTAIPGVFPPVIHDGDLLIDGGTFNNFPADIMSGLPVEKVIGSDFTAEKKEPLSLNKMPDSSELLRDRFRPRHKRHYKLPSLSAIILNSTLLHSAAKRDETKKMLDLHFNPDVRRYSIAAFKQFDEIVDVGYQHAQEVLTSLPKAEFEALRVD